MQDMQAEPLISNIMTEPIQQIKSSGSLRLIKNKNVADSITIIIMK